MMTIGTKTSRELVMGEMRRYERRSEPRTNQHGCPGYGQLRNGPRKTSRSEIAVES